MFKNLKDYFENKKIEKLKKKEKEAQLNKEYPTAYCFYGIYSREVIEDGLTYTYPHKEVFLANDTVKPTSFKRLTGEGWEDSKVEIIEQKSSNYLSYNKEKYILEDNGIKYYCAVTPYSSYSWDKYISLGLMQSQVRNVNEHFKMKYRDELIQRNIVDKEFVQ